MTNKNFDLTGKVAVVTGAAGLLGFQHASALLEHGAIVFLADIDQQKLKGLKEKFSSDYSGRYFDVTMDVTDSNSIKRVFNQIIDQQGKVDILINNAAIDPKVNHSDLTESSSRFENFSVQQWQKQIDVGLTGAFLCSQVFGGWMSEHGGGVILNIASDLSVIAPDQRIYRQEGKPESEQPVKPVSYSVIKTGLIGLTRYLAGYWSNKQVRVNALSPGGVYVNQSDDFVARLTNLIPMSRMAHQDEYRGAIQFLCSDASSYMTGQNIVMDGGRTIL